MRKLNDDAAALAITAPFSTADAASSVGEAGSGYLRSSTSFIMARDSEKSGYGDDVPIVRAGATLGRIVRDGTSVRVEARRGDGSYRVLGYYERTEDSTFPRKVREIHDIFDAWSTAKIGDGSNVKVVWRRREAVPGFREQPGAIESGCSVVENDGIPIAYIYKIRPDSAVWVDA